MSKYPSSLRCPDSNPLPFTHNLDQGSHPMCFYLGKFIRLCSLVALSTLLCTRSVHIVKPLSLSHTTVIPTLIAWTGNTQMNLPMLNGINDFRVQEFPFFFCHYLCPVFLQLHVPQGAWETVYLLLGYTDFCFELKMVPGILWSLHSCTRYSFSLLLQLSACFMFTFCSLCVGRQSDLRCQSNIFQSEGRVLLTQLRSTFTQLKSALSNAYRCQSIFYFRP